MALSVTAVDLDEIVVPWTTNGVFYVVSSINFIFHNVSDNAQLEEL